MPTTASDAALSAAELPGPDRHLPFYGLVSPPFRSGADPGHLWLGKAHRAVLDTLGRAFRDGNGIAVLTGDAGTGKTSLAHRFIAMLGPAGIAVGRVSSPGQAPSDFFEAVLSAYGVRRPVHDRDTFAACIRTVAGSGRGARRQGGARPGRGPGAGPRALARGRGSFGAGRGVRTSPLHPAHRRDPVDRGAEGRPARRPARAHRRPVRRTPARSRRGRCLRPAQSRRGGRRRRDLQPGGHPDDRLALPGRAGRHQYPRRPRAPGRPRAAGATDHRGHRERMWAIARVSVGGRHRRSTGRLRARPLCARAPRGAVGCT